MKEEMKRGLTIDAQLPLPNDCFLNEVAQGLRSFNQSMQIFDALEPSGKLKVLSKLAFIAGEAGANARDARQAIIETGLTANFHPLWRPGRRCGQRVSFATTKRGQSILDAAEPRELLRQYHYIMRLFTIADQARRLCCGSTCHHWWHHLQ